MARGARSTPLKQQGGRLVSGRSKTGDPQCSAAMSAWVRARHGGAAVAAEVFRILGMCRAKARALAMSRSHEIAGNTAKAQVWAKRAQRGLSGAERSRVAAQARAARAAAGAKPAAGKPFHEQAPPRPSLREQAAAHRAAKGTRGERLASLVEKAKARTRRLSERAGEVLERQEAHRRHRDYVKSSRTARDRAEEGIRKTEAEYRAISARQDVARPRLQRLMLAGDPRARRYARLGATSPILRDQLAEARAARAAELRAARSKPTGPSLGEQVEAHRAAKGTRYERLQHFARRGGEIRERLNARIKARPESPPADAAEARARERRKFLAENRVIALENRAERLRPEYVRLRQEEAKAHSERMARERAERSAKARSLVDLRKQRAAIQADLRFYTEEHAKRNPHDQSRADRLDELAAVERQIARARGRTMARAARRKAAPR